MALGVGYYSSTLATTPENALRNALIGMLGYRLATTSGGTPPVSQIAGLSILGVIGLVGLGKGTPNLEDPVLEPVKEAIDQAVEFAEDAASKGVQAALAEREGVPEWWPWLPNPFVPKKGVFG